jgi:hypothetical protein
MGLGVHAVMKLTTSTVAVGFALALAACSSGSNSDALRIGGLMFQSVSGGGTITRDQAAAIPYASIGVQLGGSSQGLAVLGKGIGADRYWYSGNRILFVTRDGRVVQTVGLPHDLTHLDVRTRSGNWTGPGTAKNFSLVFDFADVGAFNVVATCTDENKGPETITILGANLSTEHHTETCDAPALDWSFQNQFWIDPKTHFVWQSEQEIHPHESTLYVSVFRPEAPATSAATNVTQ